MKPNCPRASDTSRRPNVRENGTFLNSPGKVSRQAQVLITCETPARASISIIPQPMVFAFSRRVTVPACLTKRTSNAAPRNTATSRRRLFVRGTQLGISETQLTLDLSGLCRQRPQRPFQRLRSIHVLPIPVPDVECLEGTILRHQAHPVGQGAIPVFHGSLKPVKKHRIAVEHARVQGFIALKILAYVDNAISAESDFGCVVDVEHAINIAIHGENYFLLAQWVTQKRLRVCRIEDVVCHHQQERLVNYRLRAQDGHTVGLVVVRILHPGYLNAFNRMVLIPLLNPVAAVAEDDDEPVDP